MKIFLGDLVHDWEKVSLWTIPLNIGFIGAYAQQQLSDPVTVKLFKRPDEMIAAIKSEEPDVVGLSHYVWNMNLNKLVFDIVKELQPATLTVGGGPYFTKANSNIETATAFFTDCPQCDAYVLDQGERGFAFLMQKFIDTDKSVDAIRTLTIDGVMTNGLALYGTVNIGPSLDVIRDLDEIPSPYLNGMLDRFFDGPFVPIIETNRSCPYRCTFCAWGIGTEKLAQFSDDRVYAELEYISKIPKTAMNLFIADANFSVLERDQLIARKIKECHDTDGYPGHAVAQWNKTRPDRVLRVAKELGNLSEVGASMQSLNPDVLSAIKRKNLSLDVVRDVIDQLRNEGIDMTLFTELIIGLPNETWQSHIDANRELISIGAEVFNYNLHLLPGTEMDTAESRDMYFRSTGWRMHDNAFGIYDGKAVIEGQEVVLETSTMTKEELRSFRFIHFLIQFMWGRKWFSDYLQLFKQSGIHPVDVILKVREQIIADNGEIGDLYERFKSDHDLENFETFEQLQEFWCNEANMERLRSGQYGKLNAMYTYEILIGHYDSFTTLLYRVAEKLAAEFDDTEQFLVLCKEILEFSKELRVSFSDNLDSIIETKFLSFKFDLLNWREHEFQRDAIGTEPGDVCNYEFYLTDRQKDVLIRQLSQFRSHNVNLTLRKMSEEIGADEFFYHVRPSENSLKTF